MMLKFAEPLFSSRIFRTLILIISILWLIFIPRLWSGGAGKAVMPPEEYIFTEWNKSAPDPDIRPDFRRISAALTGFKDQVPEISRKDLTPLHKIFRLAATAPELAGDEARRAEFLAVHGVACALLLAADDQSAAETYADELEDAAEDDTVWRAVATNPAALAVMPLLRWEERDLAGFFIEESGWLAEALAWQDLPDDPADF